MHNDSEVDKYIVYNFNKSNSSVDKIPIPIPLPEYVEVDEFVAKVGALDGLTDFDVKGVSQNINKLVLEEIVKYNDERDDKLIEEALSSSSLSFSEFYSSKVNDTNTNSKVPFADQFNCIMHNSPCDHLTLLIRKEIAMASEVGSVYNGHGGSI